MTNHRRIAYFSMEVGLRTEVPTYSGGLGVLAGDTLKSAADLEVPLVGVTMLYHKGYFRQQLDEKGIQSETPLAWNPADYMTPLNEEVSVTIAGREVNVRAWRYDVVGCTGHKVPVYFLDTALPSNAEEDQAISHFLYGGDNTYRLQQEIVLGLGGLKMLAALGHQPSDSGQVGIDTFHMNEGHAALLTAGLLEHRAADASAVTEAEKAWVKERCVFTTHTPVEAGHDRFAPDIVADLLPPSTQAVLKQTTAYKNGELNMTYLALGLSRYINGVAKRHGEVSKQLFPEADVVSITNGVHVSSWTDRSIQDLFDTYASGWQVDNHYLRYLWECPVEAVRAAHQKAKERLFAEITAQSGETWDPNVFTIGFARRAATYKRADLLFEDPARLDALAEKFPGLQILFSGKAHPKDEGGKALIKSVHSGAAALKSGKIKVLYLQNYDMTLGALLTAGVDIWLNNPVKPMEASGTSGMKAALNGVPSLSTLDGWWVEGCVEGVTGWEIRDEQDGLQGEHARPEDMRAAASNDLYVKLADTILPMYYENPEAYGAVMRQSMAINGSYFNTQRMVEQYMRNAYRLPQET